eukprot:COSAG03_NODE_6417_length_1063_cov_20.510373_2_plen_64_part_00
MRVRECVCVRERDLVEEDHKSEPVTNIRSAWWEGGIMLFARETERERERERKRERERELLSFG